MPKPPISFKLDAKTRASSFAQAIRLGRRLPLVVERRPRLSPRPVNGLPPAWPEQVEVVEPRWRSRLLGDGPG